MRRKASIIFIIILCIIESIWLYNYLNVANLESLEIKDNMKDDDYMLMEISLSPSNYIFDDTIYCYVTRSSNEPDYEWIKAIDNKCKLEVSTTEYSIYLKNRYGYIKEVASKDVELNKIKNLAFDKKEYFVPVEGDETFQVDFKKYGVVDSEIKYSITDENILKIEDNKFIGLAKGTTEVTATVSNKTVKTIVHVMDSIVEPVINSKKKYIECKQYSEEDAVLLDKALKDRVETAGYQTRAGAVAAARFLALEFADKIPYFYENGRLKNYGEIRHVDGEGRYYHQGLYLSESKFKDITKSYKGPAIWGCKLMNLTSEGRYRSGVKYPNGLDCSGFISWALLNGGFDVGDVGAGDISYRDDDLYDLGDKRAISMDLINSGEVKVGDLIAYWGHMAMIVGMDEDNLYIAESLPETKGVVVKKYTKKKAVNLFVNIMLMDEVYKEDGNLTIMW